MYFSPRVVLLVIALILIILALAIAVFRLRRGEIDIYDTRLMEDTDTYKLIEDFASPGVAVRIDRGKFKGRFGIIREVEDGRVEVKMVDRAGEGGLVLTGQKKEYDMSSLSCVVAPVAVTDEEQLKEVLAQ